MDKNEKQHDAILSIGEKYGCLTILDTGEEYAQSEKYLSYLEKREFLTIEIQPHIEKLHKLINENQSLFEMEKQGVVTDIEFHRQLYTLSVEINIFNKKMHDIESKLKTHYKCKCKCGKIHYYHATTIKNNPKYCFYPVPISTRHTYSVEAQNATYRKQQKYADLECVILCDKSECIPSDDYCNYYNAYKIKQLAKKEEKLRLEIANVPRVNADNYDVDFMGKYYESLYIEKCCNEHLESKPTFNYSQQHHKHWHNIIVYKQYKCRCILCGKVQYVNCDKFGIYPPTEYGYHAYHGYWSEVSCKCHYISSFQWIVNKLLIENNVPYRVEYSFPELYGDFGINKLRFDFAILNDDSSIKCLIECQGEQHYMPIDEFGGETQYDIQVKNDELKREYAKKHHIQLIEISYKDKKYKKIESILKKYEIIKN